MEDLLESLHRAPSAAVTDIATWKAFHRARPARSPVEDAVFGGASAATIGLAFLSGYQAALRQLVPSLPRLPIVALAATESGGGHPKAIETRLENGQLKGHKRYITLGAEAERLLVVARASNTERTLVVVEVEASAPGLAFSPLPPLPFAPELPHAALVLDTEVQPDQLLPGDGYLDYLKPFRTIEDLHVLIAILAHAAARAQATRAPHELRARLASVVAALLALVPLPPLSPAVHIALAGAFTHAVELLPRLGAHLLRSDPPSAEVWTRDLGLLGVAETVRAKRLARAWEAFA